MLVIAVAAAGQQEPWKTIPVAPLHSFTPQQPRRLQLPNGLVIFLQEDHELPLIEGSIVIRGGSRDEPAAKTGLVDLLGETWRTGGTTAKTGDQLDDFLESKAAKVETGGDIDSTEISWSSLKGDIGDVVAVVADVLQNPEFRNEKLTLAKAQMNTAISRRNDDLAGIARRESTRLGYGTDSPYAREPEYYTVNSVTRQDLIDWHKAHVYPNNMILGLSGDFNAKELEALLRKVFGSMPRGPQFKTAAVDFKDPQPGIYFIPKDDVNQSAIRMVYLGATKNNPDYYAIEVLNEFFGGGFSSRLFSNLRSKKGLAYSVGGGLGTSYDHPGLFRLSMGTKSQTTAEAIQGLFSEVDDLNKRPASDAELKSAKDSILSGFVFNFDSKDKVLSQRMRYEFYGYPADFLEKYRSGIDAVTASDVARAAAKYVDRNKLAVLVVGKAADFDKPLSTFGPVKTVDITIPESAPPASAGAVPATVAASSTPMMPVPATAVTPSAAKPPVTESVRITPPARSAMSPKATTASATPPSSVAPQTAARINPPSAASEPGAPGPASTFTTPSPTETPLTAAAIPATRTPAPATAKPVTSARMTPPAATPNPAPAVTESAPSVASTAPAAGTVIPSTTLAAPAVEPAPEASASPPAPVPSAPKPAPVLAAPVTAIPVTPAPAIPAPETRAASEAPATTPAAPSTMQPASTPGDAAAIIAKVIADLGGKAKLLSIKAVRQRATILANTPQGELSLESDAIVVYPDKVYRKIKSPMGDMVTVISPDNSFMKMGSSEARDLPSSGRQDMVKDMKRDVIYVAQHVNDAGFSFTSLGTEKVGDIDASVVEVKVENIASKWYVDPKTGHVIRIVTTDGPNERVVDLSDFRRIEGVSMAFKRSLSSNGEVAGSAVLSEVQFNPTVDATIFDRAAPPAP